MASGETGIKAKSHKLLMLKVHRVSFIMSCRHQSISMWNGTHLFLLDFQVNLGSQRIQSDQAVLALHGILGFQGGQQDQVVLDCCCYIRRESG